jgi:hypothetical protein
MTDETAKEARLMRATDAVIEELERQEVLEIVADKGFNPVAMAAAAVKAADGGDAVPFPGSRY